MNITNVSMRVVAAEVYRRGCTITYRGMAELVEGANRLAVENLPEELDDGSVALRLPAYVSQGQVKVVRERDSYLDEVPDEPTELMRQLSELDRKIDNKELELSAWKGLASKIGGNTALEYLERYPSKLDELSREIVRLRDERRVLARQCDDERERSARPRLEIDAIAARAGKVPLELVCRSDAAGWWPEYDVLVDDLASPLRLRLKASVWQRTGDDWEGIALRLGTGSVSVLGDLPRFVPRYLRKAESTGARVDGTRSKTYRLRAMSYEEEIAMPCAAPSGPDDCIPDGASFADLVEPEAPEAEVVEQATATTYELEGAQTLAANGEEQIFTIATSVLEASYYLYAYPRRDESVYLVAHLDTEPAPEVIEHPLSVYIEGSYAGSIRIGRATDERGYELPLGRDSRVSVHRTESVKRSARPFAGKVAVEHACGISVESRTRETMRIVVIEQVPVSRDKEIEVVIRDGSEAAHDKERGELRWERTLAPGERMELATAYVVSHPKGWGVEESAG